MASKMGYRESLAWLALNDDTEFLDDAEPMPSVTLSLVADIFAKTTDDAMKDLRKMRDKIRNAKESKQ